MAVKWFNTKKKLCGCEADITQVSTVIPARRGPINDLDYHRRRVVIRSRQIRHYRKRDEAHFWHWEDKKSP